MTLYQQLGGRDAVFAAVDIFYAKVLADDRIRHFFDGVDMNAQKAKQRAFLAMAFGGPHEYSGKDLTEGHAPMVRQGLNDSHVDAVAEHLGATLVELGVAQPLIDSVLAIAEGARNAVLGRQPVTS